MRFKVESEVIIEGVGKFCHEHEQEFDDNLNVFGRVLEYHKYMYRTFPRCEFRLIKAKEIG